MTKNNLIIKDIKESISRNTEEIKELKKSRKPKLLRPEIKTSKSTISIRKAYISPEFTNKTVLTDSTWRYVEILLKSKSNKEALNYWKQAENFFLATQNLDIISKPLTSYYCLLNATKTLLTFKNIKFGMKHGVSGKRIPGRTHIQNELISLKPRGVLSGLIDYFEELKPQNNETYNLKDILYNLEYIHRAYLMTFSNQSELFIPVDEIRFVHDKHRKEGWLEVTLESQYSNQGTMKKITGFSKDRYYDNNDIYIIRRNKTFYWEASHNAPNAKSLSSFKKYYLNNRKKFRYIYSPNKLWYIKRSNLTNGIIDRNTLVLTFAAMHRLSEMSRYDPNALEKHLSSGSGWLLTEFITKSSVQFIDMISSEITGDDFRVTGFRS
ncbi:YaaC family protein [Paenibacillus sp. GCM10028914]|uniref:YaaC family protein n=1 Tax=Paenibacillus sp. GCM10028914 TaxID=3273416 RepID=UPI003612819F